MTSEAPTVQYRGGALFARTCHCGRFVKPSKRVKMGVNGPVGSNARCRKCGRVQMTFLGYYE